MSRIRYIVALAALVTGCNTHPVEEPVCGTEGENVVLPTDRELCVYRWPIVIETGFTCPVERRDFFEFEPHFGTCSDFGAPRGIERDFLIDRYGVAGQPWPSFQPTGDTPPETNQLDLLWVIDNSGSMCQEQAQLRENFGLFIEGLAAEQADFQLAITTTDMNPDYALEPVAVPGRIQSRPQPVPGFDLSCHVASDENGMRIAGDYAPVRQNIEVAVNCMVTPDTALLEVTDEEIECALYASPSGCTIDRAGCGGGADPCTPEDIFPSPDSYREIPRVMKSSDYTSDGELDTAALAADFACASLVGTRGYGIEKGLAAAVAAVSPHNAEMNAGFLREDARFAVMFVTDENDCSHDGTLPEDSACGGDVCEFWNSPDVVGGPLVPVAELKSRLLNNLSGSKGRTVTEGEVFVGSIHGQAKRFTGDVPTLDVCGEQDYPGIEPSCATSLGVTFSGDRYDRFIAQFRHAFPQAEPDGSTSGWMCQGDFSPALGAMGDWLGMQVK